MLQAENPASTKTWDASTLSMSKTERKPVWLRVEEKRKVEHKSQIAQALLSHMNKRFGFTVPLNIPA